MTRSPDGGSSNREVLLAVDETCRWWPVRELLQTLAGGDVRIWRIRFEAGGKTYRINLDKQRLCGGALVYFHREPTLTVSLDPVRGGKLRVLLLDEVMGFGEIGFAKLTRVLSHLHETYPHVPCEVSPSPDTPAGAVARLLAAYERAGWGPPGVDGVPPWSTAREDVLRVMATLSGCQRLDRLEKMTRAPNALLEEEAFRALGDLGEESIPVIERALTRADTKEPCVRPWSVHGNALRALARIGREKEADLRPAWPTVLRAVEDMDYATDGALPAAAEIARRIGPAATEELEQVARKRGLHPIPKPRQGSR